MLYLIKFLKQNNIQFINLKTHLIINPNNSPQFEYLYYNFESKLIPTDSNIDLVSIKISSIPTNPKKYKTTQDIIF